MSRLLLLGTIAFGMTFKHSLNARAMASALALTRMGLPRSIPVKPLVLWLFSAVARSSSEDVVRSSQSGHRGLFPVSTFHRARVIQHPH